MAQLQGLADSSPLVAGPGNAQAPLQRALAYNAAVATVDIDQVEELAAKVFRLSSNGGQQLIIKFEIAADNQTEDEFESRWENTLDLSNQVLHGVPQAQALTANDVAQINAIGDQPANFDPNDAAHVEEQTARAHLKAALALIGNHGMRLLVLKAQNVNVGANLHDELQAANAPGAAANAPQVLRTRMTTPAMLRSLGQMATFDLLVNNYDRFRPDATINNVNIDIDANTVLGIDNLNPNDRILHDTWDGGGYLESSLQMKIYAYEVVRLLFADLGIAPTGEAYKTAANRFHTGMVNAAQTLKAHKGALTARRNGQPHGEQKVITLRLERRLDRILSK